MSDMRFLLGFATEMRIPKNIPTDRYAKYFKDNGFKVPYDDFNDGVPFYKFKENDFIPYFDYDSQKWYVVYTVKYIPGDVSFVKVNLELQKLEATAPAAPEGKLHLSDDIRMICLYWYDGCDMPSLATPTE